MKHNNNTKKHKETFKTNNGLYTLILRYNGVQEWYIKEANVYLLREYGIQFNRAYVSKIVHDTIRLSPKNYVLKEALEFVVSDWGRKIGDLKEGEMLVSTPKGVRVIKAVAPESSQLAIA